MQLTDLERGFINHYQGNFPLQERPFKAIASQLNSTEDKLIETVRYLKKQKVLTRFGPLYDAVRLGGGLTLAALSVPDDRYAVVTETVNAFPEVAHNYRRDHALNMWFVLATEASQEINSILRTIEQRTQLKVYNFPKQHEFYIGLWFHLASDGRHTTTPVPGKTEWQAQPQANITRPDDIDRKLISVTQSGFAIEHTPYRNIADDAGISQQEVIQRLQNMLSCGIIRRIGAVPNHYRLGLTANGMTVWDVDDDKAIELGNIIGQLDFVSHCYQRPRHLPMWRYNLFAMVHGADKENVNEKAKQIKRLLGVNRRANETLFSSAILKKTGLRLAA